MSLADGVASALAERSLQFVGFAFGCLGVAHFAFWAQAPGREIEAAVATGDAASAAPEILAYAQSHPAYLLAFLAGAVLLVRRP